MRKNVYLNRDQYATYSLIHTKMHSEPAKNSKQFMMTSSFSIKLDFGNEYSSGCCLLQMHARLKFSKRIHNTSQQMRFHKKFTSGILQMLVQLPSFFKENTSLQNSNIKTFLKHKIKARVWARKHFFPKFKYPKFPQTENQCRSI